MAGFKASLSPVNPLLLREIVVEVMIWISLDDEFYNEEYSKEVDEDDEPELILTYGKHGVLARCSCVNQLWFNEATPLLWAAPTQFSFAMDQTLPKIFARIDMSRRQLYATFVKEAVIAGVSPGEEAEESDKALQGLEFPKLEAVAIPLAGWGQSEHIPRIGKNGVKTLTIDPSFDIYPDTYRVTQDEFGSVLEQIPDIFPGVEEVDIVDSCLAYPGAIEKCKSRLPMLKWFGSGRVVVGNDYPASQT